jgi:hypothetical protein
MEEVSYFMNNLKIIAMSGTSKLEAIYLCPPPSSADL